MQKQVLFIVAALLPVLGQANDFPTLERVEYVLRCMNEHGGEDYNTLYGCVCKIDQIAAHMTYEDYAEAEVFRQLRSTPGERGGVFRDPPRADELRDKLQEATDTAEKSCFIKKG